MRVARFILLVLLFGILGIACGRGLRPDTPELSYVIENHNWNTATVTFGCDGQVLKREHNLSTGERRKGRINALSCQSPNFVVTFLGSTEVIRSGQISGWTTSATLLVVIQNAIGLSYHRLT